MTKNQLEYQNLVERKRSNLVNESLEGTRNRVNTLNALETMRANRSKEAETERHNKADEAISMYSASIKAASKVIPSLL